MVIAVSGRTLAELDAAISTEMAHLAAAGPTAAEMERGIAQAEVHFISRLQTVGGFGGKSDQLNAYNVFLGDADYFDRDLARYRKASADDLTRATREWLGYDRRVVLSVVPSDRPDAALSGSRRVSVS